MSDNKNPAKPVPNDEKFKPQNVADAKGPGGRDEQSMKDMPRGSEPDSRGRSSNRTG